MQNDTIPLSEKSQVIPSRKIDGTFPSVILHPDPILQGENLSITIVGRFLSKVRKTDFCWHWGGAEDHGRGVIGRGGAGAGTIKARRLSWLIYLGELPSGNVQTTCGNTLCVNPEHLVCSENSGSATPPIDWARATRLIEESAHYSDYTAEDPTLPPGFTLSFKSRFWDKVDKRRPDECWPWLGALNDDGYGSIGKGRDKPGNIIGAHIASYIMHKGQIPKGMLVCHTCDNRACVNPAHLRAEPPRWNTHDAVRKNYAKGKGHWNAALTPDQVAQIRRRFAAGNVTMAALAREFGITRSHVSSIIHMKCWNSPDLLINQALDYSI